MIESRKFNFKSYMPVLLVSPEDSQVLTIMLMNNSDNTSRWWSLPGPLPVTDGEKHFYYQDAVLTPAMYCVVFDRLDHLQLLVQAAHIHLNDLVVPATFYFSQEDQIHPKCQLNIESTTFILVVFETSLRILVNYMDFIPIQRRQQIFEKIINLSIIIIVFG